MMRHVLILSILCLIPLRIISGQDEASQTGKSSDSTIYKDEISGFGVGDANALDVVNLLNDQFPNLTFSAEPTTNRIYARVPKPLIDEIEEFVEELAITAAEHRQRQEVLRRKLEEEEKDRRQRDLDRRREEEQTRLKEQEEQAQKNAEGRSNPTSGWNSGFGFEMPLGMRLARTQLQAAELKLKKMRSAYGPNHPSIRNAELEVEAIRNLVTPRLDFIGRYTVSGSGTRQTTNLQRLEFLAQIMKELRPDLKVELEGIDQGLVMFRGSEDAVEEAQRIMKALEEVARNSDPAALQQQYENAEESAANIADQLREANSAMSPDRIRLAELRAHLTDSVQLAFELRLQLQQYQLERAEADLMTSRSRLIRREQIAEQIIERRVEELEVNGDTAWSPAQAQKESDEQHDDTGLQIDDVRRRLTVAEAQYAEANEIWIRDRKKLMSDREQLASQVDDLREKLKAATRVTFDSPREPSEERQPKSFGSANPNATEPSKATQENIDVGKSARSFGIWLGEVTDLSEYKTDYRGGIRITAVISNTPAEKAGIKAGDVLVGLETWETTSLADLAFVLKKFTESSDKDSVKFFVMRNGETMTGEMSIPEFASAEATEEF